MSGFEFKAIRLADASVKVDVEERTFEGYASVFGVRDRGGDVVVKGAFADTIATRFPQDLIKVFRDHWDLVGMPLELREDDTGLFVRAKLDDTQVGRDTLSQLQSRSLAHMSFGYNTKGVRFDTDDDGNKIRYLEKLELWEVSPVAWPMNEAARISQLKSARAARGYPLPAPQPDLLSTYQLLEDATAGLESAGALTDDDQEAIREVKSGLGTLGRRLAALPRTRGASSTAAAAEVEQTAGDSAALVASLQSLLSTLNAGGTTHGHHRAGDQRG